MSQPEIEISIVLPAYEEAENLKLLLPQLRAVLGGLSPGFEIVVVDTEQPRDATPEVCRENDVRYLPREGGSFYGDAIRTGIRHSLGKYIICMDADGSHDPDFLPQLWKYRGDYDLVIASRYVPGGKTENSAILIGMSLMVNIAFRLVLGLRCHDVSNSFRLYQGDALRALTLECNHFDVVEEILVKLSSSRPSYRIMEVPFTFKKRHAGKTKRDLVSFALNYLGTLCRLYRLKQKAKKQS